LSDIRANTISDAAGTGPITLTGQSAAKVWVNYNSVTTTSIRESFNVSTLTDEGTGLTTVTFTSNMNTSTYSVPSGGGNGRTGGNNIFMLGASASAGGAPSTSEIHLLSSNQSGTTQDGSDLCITIHGDLA